MKIPILTTQLLATHAARPDDFPWLKGSDKNKSAAHAHKLNFYSKMHATHYIAFPRHQNKQEQCIRHHPQ